MENIQIKLSERLSLCLDLVREDKIVFDIGADHGYFSLALLNKSLKVYASENKIGPFNILKENTKDYISSRFNILLSDGIDILPTDVNMLTILGMGGDTIFKILSKHIDKLSQIEYILIEPQSDFEIINSFLLDNDYINVDGLYLYERRYYPALLFKKGSNKNVYNNIERLFGYYPLHNKDKKLFEFLKFEIKKIDNLNDIAKKDKEDYYNLLTGALKYYE